MSVTDISDNTWFIAALNGSLEPYLNSKHNIPRKQSRWNWCFIAARYFSNRLVYDGSLDLNAYYEP
jgi:hypothetical protein